MPPETATYPAAPPLHPQRPPLPSPAGSPCAPARPLSPLGPPLPPPAQPPSPAARRLPSPEQPRVLAEPHRPAGRVSVARLLSCTLLSSVVLVILVAIGGMVLGLWRFTVIDTGSMRPTLAPGDVAVLTSEPRAAIARGQIVAFHPPGEPRLTVVHRVFAVHRRGDATVIQTKGDANNVPDAWRAQLVGDRVWRESAKVPLLGYLSAFSAQRAVRFGLLIAIVMMLAITLLGAIWRSSRR